MALSAAPCSPSPPRSLLRLPHPLPATLLPLLAIGRRPCPTAASAAAGCPAEHTSPPPAMPAARMLLANVAAASLAALAVGPRARALLLQPHRCLPLTTSLLASPSAAAAAEPHGRRARRRPPARCRSALVLAPSSHAPPPPLARQATAASTASSGPPQRPS
nr:atherin-like [Aegilops tauschii subsp. strangulata]